jgi:hypothetical protein
VRRKKSAIFNFLLRFQTQEGTGKHLEDLQARAEKEICHFNFLFRFQTQEGTGKHLEDLQARAEKEIRYKKNQLLEL